MLTRPVPSLSKFSREAEEERLRRERETEEEKPRREAEWREKGLHDAAARGKLEAVKYLCEVAKVNKETIDKYGNTPLHKAAEKGQLEVIRYLCEAAKVNKEATSTNKYGNTPLHQAAAKGHLEVVRYFCEVTKVNKEAIAPSTMHSDLSGGRNLQLQVCIPEALATPFVHSGLCGEGVCNFN